MMASIYADEPLKRLVQARVNALSDPDEGEIVSEKEALVDMLDTQYRNEYLRRKGDRR